MNSIANYGSDDDYEDSSEEKQTDWRGTSSRDKQGSSGRQTDTNYEEVQMDLSEGSNDSKPETKEPPRKSRVSKDRKERDSRERRARRSREKDSKSRESRTDHHRRDRDRDRRSRRSSSKERRRSRSPRRSERERSRSKSRDRARKYAKRYERSKNDQPERNDRQKPGEEEKGNSTGDGNRFFMPGITGRFRDQIERRKQLWQKKDNEPENKNGQSKKVWETTTFAQDTDGKVANKFKRLMGIKGATGAGGQGVDVLRKQEEMFSSMEQQYEVARTATHTMRGVGLGFSSYQR